MNILVVANKNINIIMLVVGIVCLLLVFFIFFLYKRKLKQEKTNKETFAVKEVQTKYKIFYFWSHVIYIFIIFTLFVAAIISMTIGIGGLLK